MQYRVLEVHPPYPPRALLFCFGYADRLFLHRMAVTTVRMHGFMRSRVMPFFGMRVRNGFAFFVNFDLAALRFGGSRRFFRTLALDQFFDAERRIPHNERKAYLYQKHGQNFDNALRV